MKANRKFIMDDDAVSPVIAVILLVAITVVLAASIWFIVNGMTGTQEKTPNVVCTVDNANDKLIVSSAERGVAWDDITITYTEGATLTNSTSFTDKDVTAGDYITVSGLTGNVEITFVYEPSNSIIGTWTVYV